MALYSDKVMEHFMNPRNVGEIENPDGMGEVGNPVCGDMMTFYIKVENSRISDVKFKTFGCGAAIAVSSMVSEMAKGKTLEEALKITNAMVAEELGGLPKNKLHCSNLGADALHAAIKDYMKKHGIELAVEQESAAEEEEGEREIEAFGESEAEATPPSQDESEVEASGEAAAETSGHAAHESDEKSSAEVSSNAPSAQHYCPYCDEPLEGSTSLLCNHCHISFIECPSCGKIVSENLAECPHCGAPLKA